MPETFWSDPSSSASSPPGSTGGEAADQICDLRAKTNGGSLGAPDLISDGETSERGPTQSCQLCFLFSLDETRSCDSSEAASGQEVRKSSPSGLWCKRRATTRSPDIWKQPTEQGACFLYGGDSLIENNMWSAVFSLIPSLLCVPVLRLIPSPSVEINSLKHNQWSEPPFKHPLQCLLWGESAGFYCFSKIISIIITNCQMSE